MATFWSRSAGIRMAFVAALLAAPIHASAHSNEELADRTGPHGGMIQMSGKYHMEVVQAGDTLKVWVTDHADKPQSTEGATAKATIFVPNGRKSVDLKPTGDNELNGQAPGLMLGDGARVVIDATMKGADPVQVRFQFPSVQGVGH